MTPRPPAALRAALEARLVKQAHELGVEAGLLRRRLVFQRLVRRLPDDGTWVVKGGFLLEARLPGRARMTKDLDLVSASAQDLGDLRSALEEALGVDVDGDHLVFVAGTATPLRPVGTGGPGWRVSIDVRLDGRTFDRIRLDVVARLTEVDGGVETVVVPSPVEGLDLGEASIRAVGVAQHAAEKFHALCRTYANARPSTRVKDLVDVVLLVEAGLLPDERLGQRLRAVFDVRDGEAPPADLPEPPASWIAQYAAFAASVGADARDLSSAMACAGAVYRAAVASP